jgi:hypothetical protein
VNEPLDWRPCETCFTGKASPNQTDGSLKLFSLPEFVFQRQIIALAGKVLIDKNSASIA